MCRIQLNINTTTPAGTTITSANGRYRMLGTTTWTNFVINLLNPITPDITTIGQYELQISVTNNIGQTSEWASGSFIVSSTCGTNGGANECIEYSIFANQGSSVVLSYTKCDGTTGSINLPQGDEVPICSQTYPSIVSGNATITATGLPNCGSGGETSACNNWRFITNTSVYSDGTSLIIPYTDCNGLAQVYEGYVGEGTININCVRSVGTLPSTISSSSIVGAGGAECDSSSTGAIAGGSTTPTGTFSAGMSVSHGHSLPATDPDSSEITGTLTVSNGPKSYGLTIKNQFNYGNVSTAYLSITGIGSLTVSTNGTSSTRQANGSLYVPVGTYTYTLRATLDITGGLTTGAATATIIEV